MDEPLKKQAREWFERGRHDIDTAQLLYDERGHTDSIAYHIQQALENPPGPPVDYEYDEIKTDLKKAWELIRSIEKKSGI